MKRKNAMRKALFSSVISLLLCVSMLVGTTFAWFTDEVTSSGNKIQSGSLDIELYELTEAGWNNIGDDKSPLFNWDKWEPGYTDFAVLKVENAGTLALKWAAMITPLTLENMTKLADVIDVYVIEGIDTLPENFGDIQTWTHVGNLKTFMENFASNTQGTLLAGESATLGIALHMQETAGNEYQNLSLGTVFDISIFATQLTNESDAFGDQYDADAAYPAKYKITKTVKVGKTESGAIVTAAPLELTATNDKSVINEVVVKVPAGTAVDATDAATETNLTVSVTSKQNVHKDTVTNVTADKEAVALEIKVDGLDQENNEKIVTVTMKMQTGLTGVVVYHEGVAMTKLDSAEADAVGYHYNPATGVLTVKSNEFSPFDIVYDGVPVVTNEAELVAAIAKGGKIKLGDDITVNAPVVISEKVTVTLDMSGYTITTAYDQETEKHLYAFDNYGKFTINGGTIEARGIYNREGATMTVNGTKIVNLDTNGGSCIWSYGGSVTLNNATLIGYTGCVYSDGYLEINGGTYTCYSAVLDDGTQLHPTYNIRSNGELVINGGDFTSRHGLVAAKSNTTINGGTYTMNSIGVITSHVIYVWGADAKVTVNGGEFNCDLRTAQANGSSLICVDASDVTVSVKGGTFNLNPAKYVAQSFRAIENEDGTWTVTNTSMEKPDPNLPADLPKADVERLEKYENVDLDWNTGLGVAPTEGLDSKLEGAYIFKCTETAEEAAASKYANWYCDFFVKLDKDLGENQIFLGGNYGAFEWVGFHNGDVTLTANEEIPLLGSVTQNPWTYMDVVNFVGEFICGVGDVDNALSGATFTVMLRLTNPENEAEFYNVATINFTFE